MRLRSWIAAAAVLAAGGLAFAWTNPFSNPGFEAGSLTGWSTGGAGSKWATTSGGGKTAYEGSYFGLTRGATVNSYSYVGQTVSLNKTDLGLVERMIVRGVKAPYGDFRDWATIDAWTADIAAELADLDASPEPA